MALGGSVSCEVSVAHPAYGKVAIYMNPSITAGSSVHLELRQVLTPGGNLMVYAGTDGLNILATGYYFE
jgi:hypothetical protein